MGNGMGKNGEWNGQKWGMEWAKMGNGMGKNGEIDFGPLPLFDDMPYSRIFGSF